MFRILLNWLFKEDKEKEEIVAYLKAYPDNSMRVGKRGSLHKSPNNLDKYVD